MQSQSYANGNINVGVDKQGDAYTLRFTDNSSGCIQNVPVFIPEIVFKGHTQDFTRGDDQRFVPIIKKNSSVPAGKFLLEDGGSSNNYQNFYVLDGYPTDYQNHKTFSVLVNENEEHQINKLFIHPNITMNTDDWRQYYEPGQPHYQSAVLFQKDFYIKGAGTPTLSLPNELPNPERFKYEKTITDEFVAIRKLPTFSAANDNQKKFYANAFGGSQAYNNYTPAELDGRGWSKNKQSGILYDNALVAYFNSLRGGNGTATIGNLTTQELDGFAGWIGGMQYGLIINDSEGGRNTAGQLIFDTFNDPTAANNFMYVADRVKAQTGKDYVDLIGVPRKFTLNNKKIEFGSFESPNNGGYTTNDMLNALANPAQFGGNLNNIVYFKDVGYAPMFGGTKNYATNTPYPSSQIWGPVDLYAACLNHPLIFQRAHPTKKLWTYNWFFSDREIPRSTEQIYDLRNTSKGVQQGPNLSGKVYFTRNLPALSSQMMYDYFFFLLCNPTSEIVDNWLRLDNFTSLTPISSALKRVGGGDPCNAQFAVGEYSGNDYACGAGQWNSHENQLEEVMRAMYRFNSTEAKNICNGSQTHEAPAFSYKRSNMGSFSTIAVPNDNSEVLRSVINDTPFATVWYNAAIGKRILLFQDCYTPFGKNTEFQITINGTQHTRTTNGPALYVEIF